MSFFLLGKGPDGVLKLLSAEPVDSRKDALARLSEITSGPQFSDWDDEVFVVDLDNATPVLLVRPVPSQDEAELAAPSGLADFDATEEVVVEAPEPVVIEPIAVTPVEPNWAEAVVQSAMEEQVSLSDALVRAAADMEAADQSAAEEAAEATLVSVEPSPELAIDELLSDLEYEVEENVSDEDDSPVIEEVAADEVMAAAADDGGVTEDELESRDAADEALPVEEPTELPPTPLIIEPTWPWAAGSPDAEKAPSADQESEIEAEPAPKPEPKQEPEQDPEQEPEPGSDDEPALATAMPGASDQPDDTVAAPEVHGVDAAAEPEVVSDFVLDLEQVVEAETAESSAEAAVADPDSEHDESVSRHEIATESDPEVAAGQIDEPADDAPEVQPEPHAAAVDLPPGYQPSGDAVDDMTCEDCVYVDTCPNKDQREPASCGSFQWK